MTTKPAYLQQDADAGEIVQFPDPPPEEMTAYYSVNWPGYPGALADHFGHQDTTIITSEVAAGTHLASDRLLDGQYQPISIHLTEEGTHWGHSDALELDLCWEEG